MKTVLLIIGVVIFTLGAMVFIQNHSTAAKDACIANIRQIDAANAQWAKEEAMRVYSPISTNITK